MPRARFGARRGGSHAARTVDPPRTSRRSARPGVPVGVASRTTRTSPAGGRGIRSRAGR
jgi:hypothetical protein